MIHVLAAFLAKYAIAALIVSATGLFQLESAPISGSPSNAYLERRI